MPSRRAFLAAGAATLASGCLDAVRCRREYQVRAAAYDPAEDLPADLDGPAAALAREAVREGSATAELARERPLADPTYVVHGGAYHRIDLAARETATVPALRVTVAPRPDDSPPDGQRPRPYADLPATDRAALDDLFARAGRGEGSAGSRRFDDVALPYPDGLEDSALASADEAWVDGDGAVWRVAVHGTDEVDRTTYRYEATGVAPDAETFRERVSSDAAVTPGDLSPAERDVVATAIEEGYDECVDGGRSAALAGLLDRYGHERGYGGEFVAVYEGEWYEITMWEAEHEF